jgi:hypothetical protein
MDIHSIFVRAGQDRPILGQKEYSLLFPLVHLIDWDDHGYFNASVYFNFIMDVCSRSIYAQRLVHDDIHVIATHLLEFQRIYQVDGQPGIRILWPQLAQQFWPQPTYSEPYWRQTQPLSDLADLITLFTYADEKGLDLICTEAHYY